MDSIYHRIDKVNKPTQLHQPLHGGRIGLRSIEFTIGWHNVGVGELFRTRIAGRDGSEAVFMNDKAGLYNFDSLRNMITKVRDLQLTVSKGSGLIDLKIPTGMVIKFAPNIDKMLGLDDTGWLSGRHTGDKPIDVTPIKSLYIHLDELDKEANMYNGSNHSPQSTLLEVVPIGEGQFGEHIVQHFPHPTFKQLERNILSLTPRILDSDGKEINNHDYPFKLTFVYRK